MVGWDEEGEELDSDKLRHYLVGGHVADYMRYMNENDEEKYKTHFSRFIKEGVTADSVGVACNSRGVVYDFLLCSWRKCTEMLIRRLEPTQLLRRNRRGKM